MNKSFYLKLAISNIGKNKKTYFPYIITCIFTIMMYYMMSAIISNTDILEMQGGNNLKTLLNIALQVSTVFSVIFLFYTNSFLIKRRNKELGLYNILGMEKRHIAKMMTYETIFIGMISVITGLLCGIVFSKFMFLLLGKVIGAGNILSFQIPIESISNTIILFLFIFFLTLLYNLVRVKLTKPIELLHGGEIGEKEPKTKIIMTIIGIITLGWGYYFALTTESPLQAMMIFFAAVIMVIIGTYMLFMSGSITIIKLLRRNKRYYYNVKHFNSVSGMLYRMKQNAVGLANICILSTMVLIILSTTVSLYVGMGDYAKMRCPTDITVSSRVKDIRNLDKINSEVKAIIGDSGIKTENYMAFATISCTVVYENGVFDVDPQENGVMNADKYSIVSIIPVDEYNSISNTDYTLNSDEIMVYSKEKDIKEGDVISINGLNSVNSFNVKYKSSNSSGLFSDINQQIVKTYVLAVDNQDTAMKLYNSLGFEDKDFGGDCSINFDVIGDRKTCENLVKLINDGLEKEFTDRDVMYFSIESYYAVVDVMTELYGGFLFIGIFLGVLFIMATVLIIYYKQISEGYEDKARYEIMQKVGMSRSEVKKSIKSQVLTVFFMPLIVAIIHIAVSFRIIKMMLIILGLTNTNLFIIATIVTGIIFAVVYGIVFAITTKSYYNIVSPEK